MAQAERAANALRSQVITILIIAVLAETVGLVTWTLPLVGVSAGVAGLAALLLNTVLRDRAGKGGS
jgi:hypothetical protein